MDRKAKGSNAERELIHLLWDRGWYPVRVAGSGSSKYPSPDIIAANGLRRMAIECKSSIGPIVYITKEQISDLKIFSQKMGAEPWVGFRYNADWFFIALDDLRESGKNLVVSEDLVKNKGLSINEIAGPSLNKKLMKVVSETRIPLGVNAVSETMSDLNT